MCQGSVQNDRLQCKYLSLAVNKELKSFIIKLLTTQYPPNVPIRTPINNNPVFPWPLETL